MKKLTALIPLFCMIFYSTNSLASSSYEESKTHIVDKNVQHNVYLFRGNMPLKGERNERTFVYNELSERVNKLTTLTNDEFYLIDVTLVNKIAPDEKKDLKVEKQFFANYPEKGSMVNHPVFGSLISLPEIAKKMKGYQQKRQLRSMRFPVFLDKLPKLVTQLNQCVDEKNCLDLDPDYNNPEDKPIVIYMHCEAGTDRTGALSAAYRIRYKDMSLNEAWKLNTIEAGREPHQVSKREAENYCASITSGIDNWIKQCVVDNAI